MIDRVERLGRRKQEAAEGLRSAGEAAARDDAARLGAILGGLARKGVDKVTLLFSPKAKALEMPFAEEAARSGLVPIVGEPMGRKDKYGMDRVFLSILMPGETHDVSHLAESGNTVIQWKTQSPENELSSFQGALQTARGIYQPELLAEEEFPSGEPALKSEAAQLRTSPLYATILSKAARTLGAKAAESPASWIAALLALADAGDFVSFHGFEGDVSLLQARLRDMTKLACTQGPVPVSAKGIYIQAAPAPHGPRAVRIEGTNLLPLLEESLKLIKTK